MSAAFGFVTTAAVIMWLVNSGDAVSRDALVTALVAGFFVALLVDGVFARPVPEKS